MYEYRFISVPVDKSFKSKLGSSFEKCKSIIEIEAKNGWRLKQIVTPINEKTGINITYAYEIIFERETISED